MYCKIQGISLNIYIYDYYITKAIHKFDYDNTFINLDSCQIRILKLIFW